MDKRICPFKDCKGNTLYEGDIIQHPDGAKATIVYAESHLAENDRWRADYGTFPTSHLGGQVGPKGQAVRLAPSEEDRYDAMGDLRLLQLAEAYQVERRSLWKAVAIGVAALPNSKSEDCPRYADFILRAFDERFPGKEKNGT